MTPPPRHDVRKALPDEIEREIAKLAVANVIIERHPSNAALWTVRVFEAATGEYENHDNAAFHADQIDDRIRDAVREVVREAVEAERKSICALLDSQAHAIKMLALVRGGTHVSIDDAIAQLTIMRDEVRTRGAKP